MAKQSAGFVHEHIEKVVAGVCAAFLVAAVWFGFASGRFNTSDGKSPADLIKEVGESADRTISAVQNAKPPSLEAAGTNKDEAAVEKLLAWYGPNNKTLGENAGVPMTVARAEEFPPLFISTTSVAEEDKHRLARLVDPDLPVVSMGHSRLEFPLEVPAIEDYGDTSRIDTAAREVNWIAVVSQVDLKQQDLFFKTEKYPPNANLRIVQVHLQRLDRDERWRGWQDVNAWLPFQPIDRPPASQAQQLLQKIDIQQDAITRPRLPERVDGDRIEYDRIAPFLAAPPSPEQSLERLAKDWLDRAEKAARAKDDESALIFARAAMTVRNAPSKTIEQAKDIYRQSLKQLERRPGGYKERPQSPPDRMMPILAYDLTAVPGHSYQYRIRYEALNLYAGKAYELRDPAGASEITVFSDWSPPTPPVQIDSDIQFYLTDAREQRNKPEVKVTIWKRNRRKWEKQDFRLAVGESIGRKDKSGTDFSTGAVVVDIRLNEMVNGKRDTVLVYVTPDGSLHESVMSVDRQLNEDQKKRA